MNILVSVCIIFSITLTADSSVDICHLKPNPGPCLQLSVERYYYNPSSGLCETFAYSGCGGNANNFKTLEDCMEACAFTEEICGINEEYTDCGTACPVTCANRNDPPKPCPLICLKGCFCKRGYIRDAAGFCVLPEQCPVDKCGAMEEYRKCGSACPKTCANRNIKIRCTDQCVEGCFCKEGLVRNDDGRCVDPSECPPTEICGINEEYTDCGTSCPVTCANRNNPPKTCTAICIIGCFCQKGYIRDDDGFCVLPEQCPVEVCGINEEYTDCGTACPVTCANRNDPPKPCPLICLKGCFCKRGYIRDDGGFCVLPEQCPVDKCGAMEEYRKCGTACPKTCANRHIKIRCIDECMEGCFCKGDLVRNDDGRCVDPSECPPTEKCGLHEVYTKCGSACPATCSDLYKHSVTCPAVCVEGCFCRKGYVRNDDGVCVHPEQCLIGGFGFCPKKSNISCFQCYDNCFFDGDCPFKYACCKENCGNTCRLASPFPTTGQSAVGPSCPPRNRPSKKRFH